MQVATGMLPVALEGELAPHLSRWLWLVKWLLALPHAVVLLFLWVRALPGGGTERGELRATPQAWAEAGLLGLVGRAKEAAVGRPGRPGGTDRPAVNPGRGDADEEHAVETRVTGGQRVVEPAMILVHPPTIRG